MLLPDTGLAEARQVAERLRREIEQGQDPALPAYTVSLGIAASAGVDGSDLDSLLACSDAALYRAKEGGRNRVAA